jgi:hypothetical protein
MSTSLCAGQWKPADTAGNRVVSQRDFGGVAIVTLHLLEPHLIARASFAGCLNECIRHDGREHQEIAAAIHISKGYLSKLLASVWWAQIKRLIRFCKETRCLAPVQKIADELGFELRPKKTELEMELELARARVAELEGRAA